MTWWPNAGPRRTPLGWWREPHSSSVSESRMGSRLQTAGGGGKRLIKGETKKVMSSKERKKKKKEKGKRKKERKRTSIGGCEGGKPGGLCPMERLQPFRTVSHMSLDFTGGDIVIGHDKGQGSLVTDADYYFRQVWMQKPGANRFFEAKVRKGLGAFP